MTRRKAKKILRKQPQPKLASEFNCLFCGNSKSVNARLDNKNQIGHLLCRVCGANYSAPTTQLTEAIDLYSEWIDACVAVNDPQESSTYQLPERESKTRSMLKMSSVVDDEQDDADYHPDQEEDEETELYQ